MNRAGVYDINIDPWFSGDPDTYARALTKSLSYVTNGGTVSVQRALGGIIIGIAWRDGKKIVAIASAGDHLYLDTENQTLTAEKPDEPEDTSSVSDRLWDAIDSIDNRLAALNGLERVVDAHRQEIQELRKRMDKQSGMEADIVQAIEIARAIDASNDERLAYARGVMLANLNLMLNGVRGKLWDLREDT